jgi:nucleoside-diphosphate-sugar epimerase
MFSAVSAFGDFALPKMPWQQSQNPGGATSFDQLQPGDTVAVIGASGNVGKLVALRLSDTFKVNGVVRDASRVAPFFEGRANIQLYESDLLGEKFQGNCPASLRPALEKANAIVICTGTTAFPTEAWSRAGDTSVTSDVVKALVDNGFNWQKAIASLDELGLNTPANVDARANEFLLDAWDAAAKVKQKRAILLSSIGVQRRTTMPFPILNACGVLDAKAAAEASLQQHASDKGYSYTIVRPGQLFGGPYDNNYYLGTLFQLDKDASTQNVEVGKGDELLGDTLRSTLAEVTAQLMEGDFCRDMDFTVINAKGDTPSIDTLQDSLKSL